MSFSIRRASPTGPVARRLLAALDAYLAPLYPAESNHSLPPEALAARGIEFYVARLAGEPVGCVALLSCGREAELKRLYVAPRARGAGIAKALLARIEHRARRAGARVLRLETGTRQRAAKGLYERAGFRPCPPFAGYRPDPLSLYFAKPLASL
jgi:putative acetyltransferase